MSEVKQGAQAAIEVFYSYATQDEAYFRALQTRMRQLERQQPINGWHRGLLTGGTESRQEIAQHLYSAQVILLLISPDYLGDDDCSVQMERAAARMKAGEAEVAPIILRHVELDELPFEKTDLFPIRGKAIREWSNRDEAYQDIILGLSRLFKQRKQPTSPAGSAPEPSLQLDPNLLSQVQTIINNDLRDSILRAITYLNIENVDIGLFLLSKEFEATLKSALEMSYSKGRLQYQPKASINKMRLADMIECAMKNQIVTDSATLNFLRQERNERAHGSMPKNSEREVLMKHSPLMAGLYIDYMKLLDDYKWQILIDVGETSSQVLNETYNKFASIQNSFDKKRVGLFIDYENIMTGIRIMRGIQGVRTQDVGISLTRYASQFGKVVCKWVSADPRHLPNSTQIRRGLYQAGFSVRFPKNIAQRQLLSIEDFTLIELITEETSLSQPQIYIIVTGDADYFERVQTLLDSGHIVRILSFKHAMSLRYRKLQEQRLQFRKSLGYSDTDLFIDELDEILKED